MGHISKPNTPFSGAATVDQDGTYTVDEVLAREKWDIRMRVTGYPKIVSALKFYAFPVSSEYNEYKAWNHAVYSEYQFSADPGTITFKDIFFITVVIADNVRAKITRPDLFEQEWKRWRKEHEDFLDRTMRERSIKPTYNAFNAHIVNVLQKDDGEQEFAEF
jgi:hypothetical protein